MQLHTLFPALWLLGGLLRVRLTGLRGDLALAWQNLLSVLRFSPPQGGQLACAVWLMVFGFAFLRQGYGLYAPAPMVYRWFHAGLFTYAPPWLWGIALCGAGAWQVWAILWPIPRRARAVQRAVKVMCGLYAGLAVGFFASAPANPSWKLYTFFALLSAWCLWKLTAKE